MDAKDEDFKSSFFVGQKGCFTLLNSLLDPIENVNGEIVQLMAGKNTNSLYGMILTERGIRPARLR